MAAPDHSTGPRAAGPSRPLSGRDPARPSVFFPERYGRRDITGRDAPEPEPTIDELFSQAEAYRRTAPHPAVRRMHRWQRLLREVTADSRRLARRLAAVRTGGSGLSTAGAALSDWCARRSRAIRTGWSAAQRHRRSPRTSSDPRPRRPLRAAFVLPLVTVAIVWAGNGAWPPQDSAETALPAPSAGATPALEEDSWPHAAVTVALEAAKQTVAAADPPLEASTAAQQEVEHPPAARDVPEAAAAASVAGPYRGTLLIGSQPAGARVSVDGVVRGRSPVSIGRLEAGSHVVRVDMPGYRRWGWAVHVVANQRTRIDVQLVPATGDAGDASP